MYHITMVGIELTPTEVEFACERIKASDDLDHTISEPEYLFASFGLTLVKMDNTYYVGDILSCVNRGFHRCNVSRMDVLNVLNSAQDSVQRIGIIRPLEILIGISDIEYFPVPSESD